MSHRPRAGEQRTERMTDSTDCPECEGTGEVECPEMCAGDIDCEVCNGEGVVDCMECDH